MSKSKPKFKPYTHEELGIPHMLHIGGTKIEIVFDPNILEVRKKPKENTPIGPVPSDLFETKGRMGIASYREQKIYLWTGNKIYKPTKQTLQTTFLHEVAHFIFYSLSIRKDDFGDRPLNKNEHIMVIFTNLWLQVSKQLKEFTNKLENSE